MVRLELSADDARVLQEILEDRLSDLRSEISATESLDFRNRLKDREVTLKTVLKGLQLARAQLPRAQGSGGAG